MGLRNRRMNRRAFIRTSAAAAAGTAAIRAGFTGHASQSGSHELGFFAPHKDIEEATIADLQAAMEDGTFTSRQLVGMYLDRIQALDVDGPALNSIIEINPDALTIATALDQERAAGNTRGPLHGIPIVIKDNIDTADAMLTTAGSLALVDSKPLQDATVAAKLREAGAVILGKTNLSEWANFRGDQSSNGWSGRGGLVKNPNIIDRDPGGSSSGSGSAPSANLCAAALGTETNGSIVSPATANGVVGIKPTIGLTSRAGVIPIAHSADTVGPLARTVADAAAVLNAIVGIDPRDEATADAEGNIADDYTQFLDPNGLEGARIGVPRGMFTFTPETLYVFENALNAMREAGAEIIDPADIPSYPEMSASSAFLDVLLYEFKADVQAYLETRSASSPRTLAELIEFNREHADIELRWFGQELFLQAEAKGPLSDPAYQEALATVRRLSREEGIDAVLAEHNLDSLVAPTGAPAAPADLINGSHRLGGSSSPAAWAAYPLVSVPAGYVYNLPVGITFMGGAWSEGTLIRLAAGFEAAVAARRAPQYLRTLEV